MKKLSENLSDSTVQIEALKEINPSVQIVKAEKQLKIKELRQICQTPVQDQDPFYGRFFSRKISIYVTKVLLYTPISANQVTTIMLLTGIVASFLFSYGIYIYSIIGSLLLQFFFILDCVDGEIARYRRTYSNLGVYIDRISHNITDSIIYIGITYGLYTRYHDPIIFAFGYSAAISILLIRLSELEKSNISLTSKHCKIEDIKNEVSRKKFYLHGLEMPIHVNPLTALYTFEVVIFFVLIGSIFDKLYYILLAYAIILPVQLMIMTYRDFSNVR
jgi:phosphatidylglycerophosphate synthase